MVIRRKDTDLDLETLFARVLAELTPKAIGRGEMVYAIFQNPLTNADGTPNTSEVFIGSGSNMIYSMLPGQESPTFYAEDQKDLYVRMSFANAIPVGAILTVEVEAGGTGYTAGDVLTLSAGGANATVTVATVAAGVITGVTLTSSGTLYPVGISAVTGGTGGDDATINVLTISPATCDLSVFIYRRRKGGLQ